MLKLDIFGYLEFFSKGRTVGHRQDAPKRLKSYIMTPLLTMSHRPCNEQFQVGTIFFLLHVEGSVDLSKVRTSYCGQVN